MMFQLSPRKGVEFVADWNVSTVCGECSFSKDRVSNFQFRFGMPPLGIIKDITQGIFRPFERVLNIMLAQYSVENIRLQKRRTTGFQHAAITLV